MPEGLQFSINRTRDDYVRAYRFFCSRSRVIRIAWLLLAAFPIYRGLALINDLANGEVSEWSQAQGTVSFVTFILFLYLFNFFLFPLFVARSVPKKGVEWNVLITANGIVESSSTESIQAPWEMFTAAVETKNDFVLIRGKVGFRYYPKRMLNSRIISQFREIVRKNIPKSKFRTSGANSDESPIVREATGLESRFPDESSAHLASEADSPEGLIFELTLTTDDFKRAYRLFMRRSKYFVTMWLFMAVTYLYLISGNIVDLIKEEEISAMAIAIFPVTALYIILILYLYYWKPIRIARSAPDVGAAYKIIVNDNGIVISSNIGNTARYGWEKFSAAIETADDFLFFRAGSQFNAYPKRMLTDPRDVERFRELIRENIPNTKLVSA